MNSINNEQVKDYKIILGRSYWELHEAIMILSGITKARRHYMLESDLAESLKMTSFGLIESADLEEYCFDNSLNFEVKRKEYNRLLSKLAF